VSGSARRAALAVDALRHGWGIAVDGLKLLPAETGVGANVAAPRVFG